MPRRARLAYPSPFATSELALRLHCYLIDFMYRYIISEFWRQEVRGRKLKRNHRRREAKTISIQLNWRYSLRTCTCMGELQIRSCSGPLRLWSQLSVWASVVNSGQTMNLSYLVCPFSSAKLSLLMSGSQISSYTPTIPLPTICSRSFFLSLISEFDVIQSGSQSPERTSLTILSTSPPHRERKSCRQPLEKCELYPDSGISCSTDTVHEML